jgi:P4 family phage/plasmid primase-like protien
VVAANSRAGGARHRPRNKAEAESSERRPSALAVDPNGIPAELKARPQWVCWRYVRRNGKWTKVPLHPRTGGAADSTDPDTWGAFEAAWTRYRNGGADGIGFVFSAEDPYCGVDLDDAIDPQAGGLRPWAAETVGSLNSFTEHSPGGLGVKVYTRAKKIGDRCRKGDVEIYDAERFFAMTGLPYEGCPPTVEARQEEVAAVYRRFLGEDGQDDQPGPAEQDSPKPAESDTGGLTDDQLIAKAKGARNGAKFAALYEGDAGAYGDDDSAADQALTNLLAFWCQGDVGRIDRLFRRSGLFRPKWDERRGDTTYGRKTIERALKGRTEFYRPRTQGSRVHLGKRAAEKDGDGGHGANGDGSTGGPEQDRTDTAAVPVAPELTEAADDPHRLARLFRDDHRHQDGLTLVYWREEFHRWEGAAWRPEPDKEVRAKVCGRVKREFDELARAALAEWQARLGKTEDGKDQPKPVPRKVTTRLTGDVLHALTSLTLVPATVGQPSWFPGRGEPTCPAEEVLACRNGLVWLTRAAAGEPDCLLPATPRFFSPNALEYDFNPQAPTPGVWLDFLLRLWPKDPEAIATLQEWAGYLLTGDTSQQKILMLLGPKRSGKGTIARILTRLIGLANVCAPTLAGLGTNFGLWPLLGKTLAVISDARLSGRTDAAVVVERLLSISGEDAQTVDRKNLSMVTTRLPVRFMILTNELPKLKDPSGAVVGRLIVLRMLESWYGREDTKLTERLLPELPGILLWAIKGWRRLRERGYFVQPKSGVKLVTELEDLASPVGAFIRDCCIVGPGHEEFCREMFEKWKGWCEDKGQRDHGTEQVFGRDLRAALPSLDMRQPRVEGGRVRKYVGIRLRRATDPVEDAGEREPGEDDHGGDGVTF